MGFWILSSPFPRSVLISTDDEATKAGRISTGMTEKKRTLLDIDPADRARLLASATAYAAGRRTYVVGAVSDVVAANAGRLGAAAREALADAAHAALRDVRADMSLDGAWGVTVDEYLERHPERWHDGAHNATMADAAAGLHVWWRWCDVSRWEHGTWAVYTPMDDPADAALAVRLGERLRELKPYSGVLDRMFTGLSDRLPNRERADTGWAPPTSTAVMDDGLRGRMRRAIGARTWQEFLDAVYKLGLFRED